MCAALALFATIPAAAQDRAEYKPNATPNETKTPEMPAPADVPFDQQIKQQLGDKAPKPDPETEPTPSPAEPVILKEGEVKLQEPPPTPEEEGEEVKASRGPHFFELKPFVVPVINNLEVVGQLTMEVKLELEPGYRHRARVVMNMPRLRNEIYMYLLDAVHMRVAQQGVPELAKSRAKLLAIVNKVAGEGNIRGVMIDSAKPSALY